MDVIIQIFGHVVVYDTADSGDIKPSENNEVRKYNKNTEESSYLEATEVATRMGFLPVLKSSRAS